ncbi:ECF RNA polymerase sigma-E factor [Rubripirellula lacrimiformis]|uniref:RNA polymerase sigma factor n=1 Tax=Rubripirellula lacrimiformis TaxID=1930273 RepID=A0A517NAQ4_9BACT|nr:sigma-70 family RNA polymerase sigma factor [Rubripirellula lacrimiformis]QDT04098.1 ECF RNA polymerase sigma-E factor [Rubripirellula lacrimiformis]
MSSDREIIETVLAGETNAYAALISRYERLARGTAKRIVQDDHLVDDIAQDSFIAAFKGLSTLRDHGSFPAWLVGIVRRRASSTAAKQIRNTPATLDPDTAVDSSGWTSSSMELLELIDRLPDQERIAIALKHFEGHSAQEIADMLGCPVGTITKQLSRARQRLHAWLTQEECRKHEPTQ